MTMTMTTTETVYRRRIAEARAIAEDFRALYETAKASPTKAGVDYLYESYREFVREVNYIKQDALASGYDLTEA